MCTYVKVYIHVYMYKRIYIYFSVVAQAGISRSQLLKLGNYESQFPAFLVGNSHWKMNSHF